MKPKIWKLWGEWFCSYITLPWGDKVGTGQSAIEAYQGWKAKNNK